jgi:single stranded DNA-binding protein
MGRGRDYHATEIIGRLAASPETHYTHDNGTAVTRLRVLVNEQWKDASGNDQRLVEGYQVVTFDGLAEACGNWLAKGSKVFVRGRHRTRSYEKMASSDTSPKLSPKRYCSWIARRMLTAGGHYRISRSLLLDQ